MRDTALAIMAKMPTVGHTKSRLSPSLTPAEAAALYEAMLLDTIELTARLTGVQLAIAITPPDAVDFFRGVSPANTVLLPVAGADIGECLDQVMVRLLGGFSQALAFNSDGPTLPLSYLQQAIAKLHVPEVDVVLGPSKDGGYYLIGLKRPHPELFQGIAWSTDRVTNQTLAKARALGLAVARLPTWYDIDTIADLERLRAELPILPDDAVPHTRRLLNRAKAAEGDQRH